MGGGKQDEFGAALGGFSRIQVSNVERGHTPPPAAMLHAMAEKGINVNWLLTGQGPMLHLPLARLSEGVTIQQLAEIWGQYGGAGPEGLGFVGATVPFAPEQQAELARRRLAARDARKAAEGPPRTPAGPTEPPAPPYAVTRIVEPGFREVAAEELPEGEDWRGRYVPVIGRLAAGEGVDTLEAESLPAGVAASYLLYKGAPTGAFAVRVVGDSMEPDYRPGDMVVVDPARPVREGLACVIVQADGDRLARLKILEKARGGWRLRSLNPAHPPVDLPGKRLVAAYAVVRHLPFVRQAGGPT